MHPDPRLLTTGLPDGWAACLKGLLVRLSDIPPSAFHGPGGRSEASARRCRAGLTGGGARAAGAGGRDDLHDLRAAHDGGIEVEMQLGCELEHHALGEFVLEQRAAFGELMDGVTLFAFGAHDADVDVAMLEVRRQVHGLHGDELGVEGHLAHHERAEFALDEFPDAGGSIFHGKGLWVVMCPAGTLWVVNCERTINPRRAVGASQPTTHNPSAYNFCANFSNV